MSLRIGDYVVVCGRALIVDEVHSNGCFFAYDSDGELIEGYIGDVDHIGCHYDLDQCLDLGESSFDLGY